MAVVSSMTLCTIYAGLGADFSQAFGGEIPALMTEDWRDTLLKLFEKERLARPPTGEVEESLAQKIALMMSKIYAGFSYRARDSDRSFCLT